MIKQFLQSIVPNWIIGTLLVIILILFTIFGFGINLYTNAINGKEDGFEKSKEIALNKTALATVDDINRFHGDTYYHVVSGKTEAGKSAYVFVPVDQDSKVQFYSSDKMISKEELTSKWRANCSSCSLLGENLAIENNIPLLEIKYIDSKDFLVYEYFSLKTGETYETIKLRQTNY
ncbi:cell wall elongation regulator TseB-like domain-containing protein [Aquibacillus kalidii]|uniref:cell wall elongation regulator TseB-like domain-containing protein n=1 Tax=Aquibacillus kalidii TaxID=2762597 RepID=UPI0016453237|nr:DUF5590 domain-containing protein [Aquibacillus kalidii]